MTMMHPAPFSLFDPEESLYVIPENVWLSGAGDYGKRILVLQADDNAAAGNHEFLQKIMDAVHISLASDAFCCKLEPMAPVRLFPFSRDKHPEKILVFGITPALLGLSVKDNLYKPFYFYQSTWLFSESLSILQPDKDRKTKLWKALQGLF
jgi:hypothetical protein